MGSLRIRLRHWIPVPWRKWRVVLTVDAADAIPDHIPSRAAVVVKRDGTPTWVAFDCPCRRGHRVMVNLDPARRPTWALQSASPLTLSPSIDDHSGARRCHFFVKQGRIRWAHD